MTAKATACSALRSKVGWSVAIVCTMLCVHQHAMYSVDTSSTINVKPSIIVRRNIRSCHSVSMCSFT